MSQFTPRLIKFSLENDPDQSFTSVFVAHPDNRLGERLGTIFGLIELFDLPDLFINDFFEIIRDLETEYYLPPLESEYGIEKRFEDCLKRTNRRICKAISGSVSKIDLENVHALLGLSYKDKIYLSQIGKVHAYLFHRKKKHDSLIVNILAQAGEKKQKANPEKMFSNIISGAITLKDNLFFSNDSFLEYFSPNNLMNLVSDNPAALAIEQFDQTIDQQGASDNFLGIIIQPEEIEEETPIVTNRAKPRIKNQEMEIPPENSINKLINTQERTEKYLTPSLTPNWKKLLILTSVGLKKAGSIAWKYIKIGGQKSIKLTALGLEKIRRKINKKSGSRHWAIAQKIVAKAEDVVNDKKLPLNGSFPENLSHWLNNQIAKFTALKKPFQILLILCLILFFFFCQSIVWQGKSQTRISSSDADTIISKIEESLSTAEAQNIFNDEIAARQSLDETEALLAQLPDQRKYKKARQDFENKIKILYQKLQKMVFLENPAVIANLFDQNSNIQAQGLAKVNDQLFVFDNQNQNLYQIDLSQKQVASKKIPEDLKQVSKMQILDEKNILLLNNNDFFKYTLGGEAKKVLSLEVKDFSVYNGKIYTLQPEKNQIYKHFPISSGFNTGSAWIKGAEDIKTASRLSIDGGIFIIKQDGKIDYFMAGKRQETNFVELEPAVNSPVQIASEAESSYIYILDPNNQRIVVYDRKGNLKIQYSSEIFAYAKAIATAEKEKKIFVLAGNKVLEIEMEF